VKFRIWQSAYVQADVPPIGEPAAIVCIILEQVCRIALNKVSGSASELEYHLLLAKDLKLIHPKNHAELSPRATERIRMLTPLLQKLNADRCMRKAPVLTLAQMGCGWCAFFARISGLPLRLE